MNRSISDLLGVLAGVTVTVLVAVPAIGQNVVGGFCSSSGTTYACGATQLYDCDGVNCPIPNYTQCLTFGTNRGTCPVSNIGCPHYYCYNYNHCKCPVGPIFTRGSGPGGNGSF